jgi:predicted SnoaL-like aldol condensation-catalyzing enzyme
MRTIHLAITCFTLFLISCNSDSKPAATVEAAPVAGAEKMSSLAQKNLDAMHVVDKAFATGDVSGIDCVIAADFVDHTQKGNMNRDSLKAMIKMSAKPKTMKMETIKEVADDEYAFAITHYSGTSDGKMMPAGPYDLHSVEVVKSKDGKAIEHWNYMESAEVTKMMDMMMPAKDKMKAKVKMK